jgi:hypothetical protein
MSTMPENLIQPPAGVHDVDLSPDYDSAECGEMDSLDGVRFDFACPTYRGHTESNC